MYVTHPLLSVNVRPDPGLLRCSPVAQCSWSGSTDAGAQHALLHGQAALNQLDVAPKLCCIQCPLNRLRSLVCV